ncbi:hypothetical protein IAU60_001822 [Kwoniella sp. DSM 27419]
MSSSSVMSPRPTIPATVPEPAGASARPARPARGPFDLFRRRSLSPDEQSPTRSGVMSTRSRRSISSTTSHLERSPDKRSVSSHGSANRLKDMSQSPIKEDREASLGLRLGSEVSPDRDDEPTNTFFGLYDNGIPNGSAHTQSIAEEEDEGEPELDAADSPQDSDYTPSKGRNTKTNDPNKQVIRLIFGKKRKVEDGDVEGEDEQEDPKMANDDDVAGRSQPGDDISAQPHSEERKANAHVDATETPVKKAIPRKRRKWLKKGEVDPDDPVAVARQQERHRLIDEAIVSLDKQEEMLLAGSHSQLVWLWEELERRKDLQLAWLDAREQAAMGDLDKLRDHEKKVAMSDFGIKRENLVTSVIYEDRRRIERITAERTALKRTPGSLPNLRSGRGGGGWAVGNSFLLSNGKQQTKALEIGAQIRTFQDLPRQLQTLESSEIESDLDRLGLRRSQDQGRSRSPSSSQANEGRRTAHSHRREKTASISATAHHSSRQKSQTPLPYDRASYNQPQKPVQRLRSPDIAPPPVKRTETHHYPRHEAQLPPLEYRSRQGYDHDGKFMGDLAPPTLPPLHAPHRTDAARYGYYPNSRPAAAAPVPPTTKLAAPPHAGGSYYNPYGRNSAGPPPLGVPPRA